MSTNAVASMAKQWPSPTQESMNNTWKCLFYCFVSSRYFSYGAGICSGIPEHIAFKKNILYSIV